jgi:hypothetical protein
MLKHLFGQFPSDICEQRKQKMQSHPLYIALDFDGVLHHHHAGLLRDDCFDQSSGVQAFKNMLEKRFPRWTDERDFWDADGRLFDREVHLADLLEKLPNARIVLATSWRNSIPPLYLAEFLCGPVQSRVVGALAPAMLEGKEAGTRGQLMVQWLKEHNDGDASWLALDDQPRHYQMHAERLIQTHWRGMDAQTVRSALELMSNFAPSTSLDANARVRMLPAMSAV